MRPCENDKPVVVKVGIYIVSINSIKESDMQFDMQMYFRQTWRDPRLSYAGLNLTKRDYIGFSPGFVWERIWLPDAYFENEKGGKFHTIMRDNKFLRLYQDGSVFYSTRLTLTLSCPMEFSYFPMDHQKCELIILSYGHTTKDIIYKWLTDNVETSVFRNEFVIPQFDIEKIDISSKIAQYTVGDFNVLKLHIYLHRRLEFYLTHNYIPAILVVIISWLSFFVDRDCAPARVGMGITTILTMTTLLIGVGQQGLPVVSYIKALDWYYIGCFIFVFVGLCEYSVVNYFSTKHSRFLKKQQLIEAARSIEKGREEMLPTNCLENYGFDFGTADSTFPSSHASHVSDEPEVKHESLENGVSMLEISETIENCLRILYPILFIIFNVVYWMAFKTSSIM
ncbi:glycine receptor subunit alpha-4-like isoform X2 [Dendronephthya gigantea]|nr:glycine receptor subunit alpha-4-like isoform X2 [Dendronephthya gigantea]